MTTHPAPSDHPKAGPWNRLIARSIDLDIYGSLLMLPIYGSIHQLEDIFPTLQKIGSASFSPMMPRWDTLIASLLLIFPLSMVLDALVCAWFGNTLGKHLLGIKPYRTNGRPLDLSTCLKRNYLIYVAAYMGGMDVLSPLAGLIHYIRYRRTGTTFWDEEMGTVVRSLKSSVARTVTITILWFLVSIPLTMVGNLLFPSILNNISTVTPTSLQKPATP
ncbi:RDD family protein [Parasaccharibacter sp. TMW 2.1886]|nr:RDD family protein [Parasaccharibacter sp. TMW 2.1886]MUH03504.1 hypothetical protein [Bombella sp. ESL0387]